MCIATSPTLSKLSEALSKAQSQLQPAVFDSVNPRFNSQNASLIAIVSAIRAPLASNGIAVVQGAAFREGRLEVETMLLHNSGEFVRSTFSLKVTRDDAQELGGLITYARRFSLASLVGVVSDEDQDGNQIKDSGKPTLTTIKKAKEADKVTTTPEAIKPEVPKTDQTKVEPPKVNDSKPVTPVTKPQNGNGRVVKIRTIFQLSAAIGQDVNQMKEYVGKLIGSESAIRESSQIPTEKLDMVISAYQKVLAEKSEASEQPITDQRKAA